MALTRTIRQVSVPLLILVAGAAIAAYFVGSRPSALPKPPEEKVWPVAVVVAERRDVRPQIEVFGEIVAGREAELRAMVAGRLVEVGPDLRDGAPVQAGTRLAVIDPVDYEIRLAERRAELARARAAVEELRREREFEAKLLVNADRQVELARRGLERNKTLARSGRESQRALDEADMALVNEEQARLSRAQTVARLDTRIDQQQAEYERTQAALAFAERDLAHTQVVAPFDGYLADVRLALGHRVAVGESLGRLLAARDMEVRFDLPESDFARLLNAAPGRSSVDSLLGRPVTVEWRPGGPPIRVDAVLTRIGAEIDPSMGGIRLYAVLSDAAADSGLRAGAFVNVGVADIAYESVFVLPARAVSEDGRVYVLEDERLRQVIVTILRRSGEDVIVDADFDDGARVVARQFAGIGPGLRAREP